MIFGTLKEFEYRFELSSTTDVRESAAWWHLVLAEFVQFERMSAELDCFANKSGDLCFAKLRRLCNEALVVLEKEFFISVDAFVRSAVSLSFWPLIHSRGIGLRRR